MEEALKVSILINNYNYGRFLDDAVSSALDQTYPDIEVIVVDDGSTDDSRAVLEKYAGRAKILFKDNGGQASAFNAGVAHSTGDILCFLDADDGYERDKIERIVRVYRDCPDIDWCFDRIVECDERMNPLSQDRRSGQRFLADHRADIKKGSVGHRLAMEIPPTSGLSFRKGLIERIFPLEESESCSMSENYMKYIALALGKGAFIDTAVTKQRIHGKNLYTRSGDNAMTARISILTGYWLNRNFPQLAKFSDTQIAFGIAAMRKSPALDPKYRSYVRQHFKSRGIAARILVEMRAIYYVIANKVAVQ